jgi:hypothetical protein
MIRSNSPDAELHLTDEHNHGNARDNQRKDFIPQARHLSGRKVFRRSLAQTTTELRTPPP